MRGRKTNLRKKPVRRIKRARRSTNLTRYKTTANFKRWTGGLSMTQAISASCNATLVGSTFLFSCPAAQGTYYYSLGLSFKLNDLTGYSEFQALYDQYKINGVKVRIIPLYNSVANNSMAVILHSILDSDDQNAAAASEAGVYAMREYKSYKTNTMITGRGITRYVRPYMSGAAYDVSGVIINGATNTKPTWIDCTVPQVAHYGSKHLFEFFNYSAAVQLFAFKVELEYYLSFKNPI